MTNRLAHPTPDAGFPPLPPLHPSHHFNCRCGATRGQKHPSSASNPLTPSSSSRFPASHAHAALASVTMSGRKLGGGRILGSGKGLAPPTPPSAPRAASPFAPSESTVSIASSSLSPPPSSGFPDPGQDIGATISVGAQGKADSADTGGLVCPICNEEMVRANVISLLGRC